MLMLYLAMATLTYSGKRPGPERRDYGTTLRGRPACLIVRGPDLPNSGERLAH
jgi:hypothetical protein